MSFSKAYQYLSGSHESIFSGTIHKSDHLESSMMASETTKIQMRLIKVSSTPGIRPPPDLRRNNKFETKDDICNQPWHSPSTRPAQKQQKTKPQTVFIISPDIRPLPDLRSTAKNQTKDDIYNQPWQLPTTRPAQKQLILNQRQHL